VVLFSSYPSDPRPRRAAEALAREGMRVEIVCLRTDSNEPSRERVGGVDIRRLPLQHHRGSKLGYMVRYLLFIILSGWILAIRSLTRRYDLVHVHNMPDVLVFSALVPKLFGARVILDLHDPMPELMSTIYQSARESRSVRVLKVLERWSIRFADAAVTVNRACQKIFTTRSCSSAKLHVVMNSPDEQAFGFRPAVTGQRPVGASPFVIMYHGSIIHRHGLDLAVDALRTLRRAIPGAVLRIYGRRTPFLDEVLQAVEGTDLKTAVHYLGPKGVEGIAAAIDECDVGIIPNRRSVFTELNTPTRIFEYLARGKPVIAPRAPGIEDYFGQRQLIFFELGNAEELARQIEFVATTPDEVTEIVRRGQEVYLAHTWTEERRKFLDLAGQLVAVRR
jgi:glycosyltransferase involved in cell wall biosynthesis